MDNLRLEDKGFIRVADITLAQLSRGLYRSTATAFKELVSNAYDADATEVRINTNYPEFDFVSCVDNGTGMTLRQFQRYFDAEGIGSCIKRKHNKDRTDIHKRPIIGKLGIGMMAIGQLCHSFEIESHYKEGKKGKAYHATIILEDKGLPNKEKVAYNNDLQTRPMTVGKWEYQTIDYDEAKKGFRIHSSDVRKTFVREMKSSIATEDENKMSFNLNELHERFYDKARKSVRDCKPYLEGIWELAMLCPLPYYYDDKTQKCPINSETFKEDKTEEYKDAIHFIKQRQERLIKSNFRVIFDGIELRRHIQLPTEEQVVPKLYFIDFNREIFGSCLKFSGYIFAQIASAIRPLELNGIQIRLRDVGIGGYDSTFLKY